jgi:hypothetical protein
MAGRLVAVEDPMSCLPRSGDCARLLRIILPVVMPFLEVREFNVGEVCEAAYGRDWGSGSDE